MKDLDLKDFVVNYTKNDRDNVPNFLLNIDYNSLDLKSNISPTAQIVLLPPMLRWYITERYEVSDKFYTAIELNKTHCLRINDQKLLYFCFINSWSSTGSATLLVSVSNTVYLISGDCCFSEKLFTFEKISQFGAVDKFYFDGPLCDTNVERNGIDYIFNEIASIIMRTSDYNKIIIILDPGLEFILVEVMKVLQPLNNFGQWYLNESSMRIIDQLGYGEFFTNATESSISARICVHSNLNEIKCDLAEMEGCELIKLKKPRNWKPKMKIYTKGHHTHIFSVVSHFSQKQLDNIVEIVKPKECVQVTNQMIDECGTKTNLSKIEVDKITNTLEYKFKTIYNIVETTSSQPINPIEKSFSSLHIKKNFKVEYPTINIVTEQLNHQSACPSICEEMTPELPRISEQPEPIEVSTQFSYKNTTNIILNNEFQLEKHDNFNLQMKNDKSKLIKNVQFISNKSQNCKTYDTTNNISDIEYIQQFPIDCEETTLEFSNTSKPSNKPSDVSTKLLSQNEGLKEQTKLENFHNPLYDVNDNLLPKKIFNPVIQHSVNSTTLTTNSLNNYYKRNINVYDNHFETHQILQAQFNESEKTQRLSSISKDIENDHNYAHVNQISVIENNIFHQHFNIINNESSDKTCKPKDTLRSIVMHDLFINDTYLMDSASNKLPVKKHLKSFFSALHPTHRAIYLKQIQKNMKHNILFKN